MIVILCDGSSKGNPGPASTGVVAWDRTSNPKLMRPSYKHRVDIGIATSIEAEWHALLSAMKYALAKDKDQDIYIFSDSQTIVKQARGIWKVKNERIKRIYGLFTVLKKQLPDIHIDWVPRQLVSLADKLAQGGAE